MTVDGSKPRLRMIEEMGDRREEVSGNFQIIVSVVVLNAIEPSIVTESVNDFSCTIKAGNAARVITAKIVTSQRPYIVIYSVSELASKRPCCVQKLKTFNLRYCRFSCRNRYTVCEGDMKIGNLGKR